MRLLFALLASLFAGCAPAASSDDAAARSDGDCGWGVDGCPCSSEGSTTCMAGMAGGCECLGGRWLCGADTCRPPVFDGGVDAASDTDAGAPLDADVDAPPEPLDAGVDASSAPGDAGTDAPAMADTGVPATMRYCVDIDVSNTCDMTVSPTEITIPVDQTAYFCWRNRSADYPVDVWLSYGGGYTDLAPGATWNEPPGHCLGPLAHDEYADVSTACSSFRFLIHCL